MSFLPFATDCNSQWRLRLGRFFFQWRDLLPVPLILEMLRCARPTVAKALVGLPIIALGELLRLWGLTHIGPTTRTRQICADRLVCSGPYTLCRHPLYLANFLKVLGLLILAGRLRFACVVTVFYLAEFYCMIAYEDSFLQQQFPDEYAEYVAAVPAFRPRRLHNVKMSGAGRFSWSTAVWSERRTFASTGLILVALALRALWRKEEA